MSVGLFAKQGKNGFFLSFSSYRIKILDAYFKRPWKRKNNNTYVVGIFVCKVCELLGRKEP